MGTPETQEPSDLLLLSRIAAGDHEALARLFDRHAPRILGLLVRLTRRRSDAEGLLQETFIQVWRASAGYDATRSSPLTWLFLIARSRTIDYLRRHRLDPAGGLPEAPIDHASFADLEREDSAQHLQGILARLPEPQRRALSLAFFNGLSHAQVAELQGVPLGTVKTRIRAGLRRLRDLMDESQEGTLR